MSGRLLIGLELHRILSFDKLFCKCQYKPKSRNKISKFSTRLYDKVVHFSGSTDQICDFERDDLPPVLNKRIIPCLERILTRLNASKLNPIIFSRKEILDGSIPSGYQITGLVARDGIIQVGELMIPIDKVTLQTDSGTPLDEGYCCNRLGVPLLEVSTKPFEIPIEKITEVLTTINRLIDPLGLLPRGVNCIRQDINLSIEGISERVEIKGISSLSTIPTIVSEEYKRIGANPETRVSTRYYDDKLKFTRFLRYNEGKRRMTLETEVAPFLVYPRKSRYAILERLYDPEILRLAASKSRLKKLKYYVKKYGYLSHDRAVLESAMASDRLGEYQEYLRDRITGEAFIRGKEYEILDIEEGKRLFTTMAKKDFYKMYSRNLCRSLKNYLNKT